MSKYADIEQIKEVIRTEWVKYMPMELDVSLSFVLGKISEIPTIEVSEDCISREFALEVIDDCINYPTNGDKTCAIKNAPSVVQKQVTGKLADEDIARVSALKDTMKDAIIKLDRPSGEWRHTSTTSLSRQCSICGATFNNVVLVKGGMSTATPNDILYNFCPNCGADMRGAEGVTTTDCGWK